ncbi:MAG TPA: hypothetical protein VD968_00545 [Pyrinomonadaceae bacterium]|nr:hypothetical protein [Pyrinomonadaceae bacterium]
MKPKDSDCYVDIWKDADFRGERLRVYGPAEYPNMLFEQGDWGDHVGSLRVGPHAFVMAFAGRDFRDGMITLGPNDEVARLDDVKFDDEMDSLRVIDSMKIFDRLLGREGAQNEPGGDAKKHGGKHRRKR